MATYNKFEQFTLDLANKVHDLNLDTLKVYLSNAVPSATLDVVKVDVAEIASGNGYTAGGADTTNSTSEVTGTMTVAGVDVVWTAAGGTIGPFQYAVLYNDTPVAPADPLIGWWDYGSAVTLQIGETFTVDFGSDQLFTVA
jgi:hypothetical protein